jgi:hypothetical protein
MRGEDGPHRTGGAVVRHPTDALAVIARQRLVHPGHPDTAGRARVVVVEQIHVSRLERLQPRRGQVGIEG